MTGFDIAVGVIVGLTAVFGFLRGFVQEVLALSAWIVALIAIYVLHAPLTEALRGSLDGPATAAVLAFLLLLIAPYLVIKLIARWAGGASRNSLVGPIDRVLGLGFGAIKGLIVVVLAFSILVLGYDTVWGPGGRPDWIVLSRSYAFVDASSKALVEMIGTRRARMRDEAAAREA